MGIVMLWALVLICLLLVGATMIAYLEDRNHTPKSVLIVGLVSLLFAIVGIVTLMKLYNEKNVEEAYTKIPIELTQSEYRDIEDIDWIFEKLEIKIRREE